MKTEKHTDRQTDRQTRDTEHKKRRSERGRQAISLIFLETEIQRQLINALSDMQSDEE